MGIPAATPMHSARASSEARGLPRSRSRTDMGAFSYNLAELREENSRGERSPGGLWKSFTAGAGWLRLERKRCGRGRWGKHIFVLSFFFAPHQFSLSPPLHK